MQGGKDVVNSILENKDIQAVSFVGSEPVARYVYETGTKHGKRVQALAGAKNHAIVMPDCNLEKTVQGVVDLHLQVVEALHGMLSSSSSG